jgi:hypothetical protein
MVVEMEKENIKKSAVLMLGLVWILIGNSVAQQGSVSLLKLGVAITKSHLSSLFCEGTDNSTIEKTFAGPVCAKGRVIPEFEVFFDGEGVELETMNPEVGSVEYDSRKIEGQQSTRLNAGSVNPTYFICTLSPPLNWKHKSLKFRLFIPSENHNIKQVYLLFRSEGSQYSYTIWKANSKSPRTGWIDYTFTPTQGASNLGNLIAVDRVAIGLLCQDPTQPAYILANGLTVWDGRLKVPLYCCTFDDNYIRQYEAAMYATSRGIPVSLFINKNRSDGVGVSAGSEGMTLAQNQALANAGCIHINHGVSHSPPRDQGDGVTDLWSNPDTPIDDLIADIQENRQWMEENGLGFGAGIFGSPQEWWLDHHEQYLKPYIFGRPRQGAGMGTHGLLTMWDEDTEVHAANDTNLERAYKMLESNVGTLLWTPGVYAEGFLREWTDGKIYQVTNPSGTSADPSHADWTYVRDRSEIDEGDRAIDIEVWHHYSNYPPEGSLQDFKDYIDVVAAHIAAGRLRAVDLRQLYENYLYSVKPMDAIQGDLDFNGSVDLNDFVLMSQTWLVGTEN